MLGSGVGASGVGAISIDASLGESSELMAEVVGVVKDRGVSTEVLDGNRCIGVGGA